MLFLAVACNRQVPPKPVPYSLNGADITEYVIVYDEDGPDYNKRAAEYIQNAINDVTHFSPKIKDDSEAASEHEIVVGETSRDISKRLDAETCGFEFAILSEGVRSDFCILLSATPLFLLCVNAYFLPHNQPPAPDHPARGGGVRPDDGTL